MLLLHVIEIGILAISQGGEMSQNTLSRVTKKNYSLHGNAFLSMEIVDTPIHDQELMDQFLEGIISNILIEMDKQEITTRGLGQLSGISFSHLSRIFNGESKIGLCALIKIAYALHVSPSDLFPVDINKRKTNGQRFDEITKEMDIASSNFLLGLCADYVKEWRRIKRG